MYAGDALIYPRPNHMGEVVTNNVVAVVSVAIHAASEGDSAAIFSLLLVAYPSTGVQSVRRRRCSAAAEFDLTEHINLARDDFTDHRYKNS